MIGSVSFNARACFTFAADRIYRIEIHNGSLYFLRTGGQFDLDRGLHEPGDGTGKLMAIMILAAGEALPRKHKREELIARNPSADPEELLGIHPHNFKLAPADIQRAVLLPKKWFLGLFRQHCGRLEIEPISSHRQEYHFESVADLQTAFAHLPALLEDKLDVRVEWDDNKGRFRTKTT